MMQRQYPQSGFSFRCPYSQRTWKKAFAALEISTLICYNAVSEIVFGADLRVWLLLKVRSA